MGGPSKNYKMDPDFSDMFRAERFCQSCYSNEIENEEHFY